MMAPPLMELHQTREFSAQEKHKLTRLWQALLWREGFSRWYKASYWLQYGFAALLALSIGMAVSRLSGIAPTLSGRLAVAAIGYAATVMTTKWMSDRLSRQKYWESRRAGDRFALTADGIRATSLRGRFECDWGVIETVINNRQHLVAKLPGNSGLLIVKAACEGQDVESFGTELVRRWQDKRNTVPEAST
jgi:hypothetical protein